MTMIMKPLETPVIRLKNRLVYPPMASSKATDDGLVSKEVLNFYKKITADKNLGLVIVEHSYVSIEGKASNNQTSIASDGVIEGMKNLVEVVHSNDSKVVLQINHAGSAASKEITGKEPIGASSVPNLRKGGIPKELSIEEIGNIIEKFAESARRAKEAGFDGVEIHSAHGYLLNQFFSPLSNKREDSYGGDLKNRIRIHLEVIEAVKKQVGEDYPLFLRLGACDYSNGGASVEDGMEAAVEFERAGVHILDISGGFCGYTPTNLDLGEEGYFYPLTLAIKSKVSIPVILTGGIRSLDAANRLLEEEKADLIGIGRPIFKNNSWLSQELERK